MGPDKFNLNKMETEKQIENSIRQNDNAFFEAAVQNPDVRERGGIPDAVNGASFVRSQKIQQVVDTTGAGLSGNTYDLWIVDWNIEFSGSNSASPTARYHTESTPAPGPVFSKSVFDVAEQFSIPVGGCTCYIMEPGQSPFPTDDPSKLGPVAPKKTYHLLFGDDIFSGSTRVIGKSFKAVYTAPEISAKGSVTQAEQVNYEHRNWLSFHQNGDPANPVQFYGIPMESRLPPGSTKDIVKYPGSVVRSAFDGVLQAANIQLDHNRPSTPNFDPVAWRSLDRPGGSGNPYILYWGPYAPGGAIQLPTISYPKWDANSDIHMAVFEGLDIGATFQVSRMITVETFPNAASDLIAFAKPSPLANPKAVYDAMNAIRNEERFWAAADNDLGNFAKALKKGIKRTAKAATAVASVHPATAGYVQAGKSAKKALADPQHNQERIAELERAVSNMSFTKEVGFQNQPGSRRRTKPASKRPGAQKMN